MDWQKCSGIRRSYLVPMWDGQPVLEPGWTLSFEMYFYAVFFVSMLFNSYRWIFLSIFFFITLCVLNNVDAYRELKNIHLLGDYLNMMDTKIIWCFVLGVAIGLLYINNILISPRLALLLLLICLFVLFFYYFSEVPNHGPFYGSLFSAISYSCLCIENKNKISVPSSLVFLGDISFSIYLTQYITITILEKNVLFLFNGEIARYVMVIPFLSVIILVSYISYKTLEVPLDKKFKSILRGFSFNIPLTKKQ